MSNEKTQVEAVTTFATHLVTVLAICFLSEQRSFWGGLAIFILTLAPLGYKIWKETK